MEEESTIVKISEGVSGPLFGSAFGALVLRSWPPRTKTSVNILVNPGVVSYAPEKVRNPVGEFSGVSVMRGVEGDTKELLFDLSASPAHTVTVGNHEYEIRLLHIGEVEEEGQNWFTYEFMVTKRSSAQLVDDFKSIRPS